MVTALIHWKSRSAMFTEDHQQMIVVKDIEVYSMCEHHMLPFFGKAHVAYIQMVRIVGLSKIQELLMLLQEECKYKND
jgi:GTP cyclohydrolase I